MSKRPVKELAAEAGLTYSGMWRRLHPAAVRVYAARSNAKRPNRDRSDYRPCPGCGRRKARTARLCWVCARFRDGAARRKRARQIEAWWAEGVSMRDIAARLGWSANHLGTEMAQLRSEGYKLPHRYRLSRDKTIAPRPSRPPRPPRRAPRPPRRQGRHRTLTCSRCSEHLRDPSPSGLCGFCIEEMRQAPPQPDPAVASRPADRPRLSPQADVGTRERRPTPSQAA